MAFAFPSAAASSPAAANISQGPQLPEVQTEALGFLTLAGDAKLRLTLPWSQKPAPNASLLSIASRRRLVAAAGPNAVVVASTESVRKSFEPTDNSTNDSDIKPFDPQMKVAEGLRISQVAFTSDESYLILSAEEQGGLAVHQVEALQQGSTQAAFEISTDHKALRSLVPNPSRERAELCALVTNHGELVMANLKEGRTGQVLKEQVSCVAWSNKGKQLVAGLADGSVHQMTPEGNIKAEIPRPPELDPSYYVSTVVWLENDLFLVLHVSESSQPPKTECHLISRKDGSFQYQRFNDPVDPFGMERVPHHTVLRLKDFPPSLQDLLIFSSTAVPDIGLLARSQKPLASDGPSDVFANVELADDSKRANLPMGIDTENPAPVGTALDLSSKDQVYKPIPTDELDQSPGPLPGYWVLNDEGILSIWWIVYTDSIRTGTTYPGLTAEDDGNTIASITTTPAAQSRPFGAANTTTFGNSMATSASTFGGPSMLGANSSPWGAQANTTRTAGSVFGSSNLGTGPASSAPKPNTSPFSASTFSTQSAAPPAFGQSGGLGMRASPWASAAGASSMSTFGQSGFTSTPTGSGAVFGSSAATRPGPGDGFANFASGGGFASLAGNAPTSGSNIFASTKSEAPEIAMATDGNTAFPPASKTNSNSGNPFGSQPFKLTSSFQPDPSAADDDNATEKTNKGGSSMFGDNFALSMHEPTTAATSNNFGSKQRNIFGQPAESTKAESTTPTTTPAAPKFLSQLSSAPQSSGIFGFQPKSTSGSMFGSSLKTPTTETSPQINVEPETPIAFLSASEEPLPPESTNTPDIKTAPFKAEETPLPGDDTVPVESTRTAGQPPSNHAVDAPLPPDPIKDKTLYKPPPALPAAAARSKPAGDAPLPPDPVTNKKAYAASLPPLPGAPSMPKKASDAPLPPDPVKETKAYENKPPALPIAKLASTAAGPGFKFPTNLPPVEYDSDDDLSKEEDNDEQSEGSGVDVAEDLSPSVTGVDHTSGFSQQSSFKELGGSFSDISRPDQERRGLFGELSRNAPSFPTFSRPNPVSPRSPSPVRGAIPTRMAGSEQPRSFSAPGMASQILGASKKSQSGLGGSIIGKDAMFKDQIIDQQRKAIAKKEAEETRLLVDEEDDAVQQLLKSDVEPTLDLDEFIAHAGVAPPADDSVSAQVEAVYRDINSMIDTLGLNSRSLAGFIKGHEAFRAEQRGREDLTFPEGWTLSEVSELSYIIDEDLGGALEEARVTDVQALVSQCHDMQRKLARDRNKQADLKKIIASRLDPEQSLANRGLPLTAEQAAQQSDLRREYAKFAKLLAGAEEGLTMLKAKVVSANGANGKGGPTPTIEAIVRTITKMTSMAEKRSGDIDVLENQMRKIRLGSNAPGLGSREGSPFTTPNAKKSAVVFSPDRSMRESTPQRGSVIRDSFSASVSSIGGYRTPPRKQLSGFGDMEKKGIKEKRERRGAVLGKLRSSIEKKGASVWAMEDIA